MNARRADKIESYGSAYDLLIAAVKRFPRQMWQYKPSRHDFSIQEIVVHIADSEANSYTRCRRCIAEPGLSVMAYDESRWAQELNYAGQNAEDALEVFKALRRSTYLLIKDLPEQVWAQTIEHPENGRMTLDDWLDVYERHVPEHIRQMEQVFRAWQARQAD